MTHVCVTVTLVAMVLMSQGVSAKRGCSAFGHSCFGGHGKRSDSSSLEASNPDMIGRRQQLGQEETPPQQVYPHSGYNVLPPGDAIIPIRGGSGYEDAQTREIMKYKLRDLVRHWPPCLHALNCMNLETTTEPTVITELPTDIPELTTDILETATDFPEVTRDIPKFTKEIPQHTKYIPKLTRYVPELTRDTPELTRDIPQLAEDIPDHTMDIPELTSDIPQHTRDIPELTRDSPEFRKHIPKSTKNIPEFTTDISFVDIPGLREGHWLITMTEKKPNIPSLRQGHWMESFRRSQQNEDNYVETL